jgi:thiol-disulfide isomerase/thioredoxin
MVQGWFGSQSDSPDARSQGLIGKSLRRPFLIFFTALQIAMGQFSATLFGGVNCAALAEDKAGTEIAKPGTELPPQVRRIKAPELDGGIGYLNTSKPISLEHLKGRFVLLDFWTFCCINCMHILPKLAELEEKYRDRLTVVGIHSAKFENEKDTSNISKAIERYGIKHPVINDANFKIWDAYSVQAWPTLILIDPEGYAIGVYSGEGHTPEIAEAIDKLSPIYGARGTLKKGDLVETAEKQKQSDLSFPGKVAFDGKGRLAISDTGHNRIIVALYRGDDNTALVQEVIGNGKAGSADGTFEEASFDHPQGICFDGILKGDQYRIYVADTLNKIREIDFQNRTVTTVAGSGEQARMGSKGGPAKEAALSSPWDIIKFKSLFRVAMAGSHQIWTLESDGTICPTVGSGREDLIDGPLSKAAMAQPSGLTSDADNLYCADSEASAIRSIDLNNGKVSTLVGKGLFVFADIDGPFASARLQHPLGVCSAVGMNQIEPRNIAMSNYLFIADSYNHKIKRLDLKNKQITTIAGSGKSGYKDGEHAEFAEPGGLAAGSGKLFVADTNNSVIRVITLPTAPGQIALTGSLKLIWKR